MTGAADLIISLLPSFLSSARFSPSDLTLLSLTSIHILFSSSFALFLLIRTTHFCSQLHQQRHSPPQQSAIFHQCNSAVVRVPIRINSLWFVRLLLLVFASFLSLVELFRLPFPFVRPSYLCPAYYLSSQSFFQPAFLSTLLFLLRSSTSSNPSPPFFAFFLSLASSFPFLLLHSLFFFSISLSIVPSFLIPPSLPDRCAQSLFGTMLLAALGCVYVPLFVSACWSAVTVVINKRLRRRLYVLAGAVVLGLSMQVVLLALSLLWDPGTNVALWLDATSFVLVMGCVAVGEVILVVLPMLDAKTAEEQGGGGGGKVEMRV